MADSRRRLSRIAAGALGLVLAATASLAHAEPASGSFTFARPHTTIATSTRTVSATGLSPAASETGTALALLNSYRARVGMKSLFYDTNLDAALRAHANYLQLNINRTDLDPYTEVSSYPGYTAAGAAIAEYTSVTFQSASYSSAVDLLMMDPWERHARLLSPDSAGFAVTRTTDFTVIAFSISASTQTGATTFPRGNNITALGFESSAAAFYTGNCAQTSNAWGYPVSAQFDWKQFASIESVSTSLRRDGAPLSYCLLYQNVHTGTKAQAILIPTSPLVQGAHYEGQVNATGVRPDGSRAALSLTIEFTTRAPLSATPGDQTGDKVADVLAVNAAGTLRVYKGISPGTLGHGWVVGGGWSVFTWLAHTPDVNGDGREDLVARRQDGSLFLYLGQGMGGYSYPRQVGQNWNGLRALTVVGDMTGGTGRINVVGISADGALWRYTLTAAGMSETAKIGQGWSRMTDLASVGSFDKGSSTADIIAVREDGNLYAYFTGGGVVQRSAQVGRGWAGWTALFSPGDFSGDGLPDLVGRKPTGELFSYTNLQGGFGAARKAGTGWNGFTMFG